jgi:hypothetical protein
VKTGSQVGMIVWWLWVRVFDGVGVWVFSGLCVVVQGRAFVEALAMKTASSKRLGGWRCILSVEGSLLYLRFVV